MLTECAGYQLILSQLREQIIELLREVPADQLNHRPLEGEAHETNSLAILASHVAGSEYEWIGQVVGDLEKTRHRPDEFIATADDASTLIAKIERTAAASNQVLASLTEEDLLGERELRGHTFSVRWCILHAIEHTALHLGHMQLTRQLLASS